MKTVVALVGIAAFVVSQNASADFGRTPGNFRITPNGAAAYTVPIWVPPGPNGVQPTIALSYSSDADGSIMGPGWTLGGLSAIERCNLTIVQDGASVAVQLVQSDGYCLDGKRLRLSTGTYGASGSTYRTEVADFSLITASGSTGTGPASFTVQAKNGWIYEYGNTADSSVTPTYPATTVATPYQWLLHKVRDRAGNNYVITYGVGASGSTGVAVPTFIAFTPSSLGSGSYNYTVNFAYSADNANGTENAYIAGTLTTNTNLLNSITVKSGLTTVRKYNVGYQLASVSGRYRLQTITECADDAGTNCLNPTTVTYSDGAAGLAGTASTATTGNYMVLGAKDYNGDHRADILYADGTALKVLFATSSGFAAPVTVVSGGTVAGALAQSGDVAGIGRSDIVVPVSSVWWRYSYNGSSFVGASTGYAVQTNNNQAALLDVNGDGRLDLVEAVATTPSSATRALTVYSRLNTTSGATFSFSSTLTNSYSSTKSCPAATMSNCTLGLSLQTALRTSVGQYDFNGDRRSDIVRTWSYYSNVSGDMMSEVLTLLSGGSTFSAGTTINFEYFTAGADVNNDACTDLVMDFATRVSACNGSTASWISTGTSTLGSLDWDGDGRTDLLLNNGGYLSVQLATGGSPITTSIPATSFFIGDFDGDGQADFGAWDTSGIYYRYHNFAGSIPGAAPTDFATSFVDGYGISNAITYASTALSNYSLGSVPSGVGEALISTPRHVVGQVVASDGAGGAYTKTYNYSGGVENYQGRNFEGFQSVQESDSRTSAPVLKSLYRTAFPLTGMAYQIQLFQHDGTTLVSQTDLDTQYLTLSSTSYQEHYSPYNASSTVNEYEVGGVINGQLITNQVTTYTPDSYGNFSAVTDIVTDKDSTSPTYNHSWTQSASITIYPDTTSNWCLYLPSASSVTYSTTTGEASVTRTKNFTPDTINCRITADVIEPSSGTRRVDTSYGFDSYGNLNSVSVTGRTSAGAAMTTRTSSIIWGSPNGSSGGTGQFPVSETNALSQSTSRTFHSTFGSLATETDPNGIVVANNTYDSFGRITRTGRADGTATDYVYANCASYGCQNGDPSSGSGLDRLLVIANERDTSNNLYRQSWRHFDQFDRLIVRNEQTLSGGYNRVGRQFDSLGRLYRQTAPCDNSSCSVYWTTNTYDLLGRLTQQSRPQSQSVGTAVTSTFAYAGRTRTATDPQSKVTTRIMDVNGWMRRSQDHNGYYQAFSYDAAGSLKGITDSSSNTLFSANYSYGVRAFQDYADNPLSLGAWSYYYNSLGELTSWQDAKALSFSQTYDALSRVTSRTEAEGTTYFTWGTSAGSYNIGRLESASMSGYSEAYYYDSAGRPYQVNTMTSWLSYYNYTYNNQGRVDTITYPYSTTTRLAVKYGYQYGIVNSVTDWTTGSAGTVYWIANAQNMRGQTTQETLGNGVVTSSSFDAVTGWLSSLQSGVSGGAGLQNQSFLQDLVGNITQRQENNLGLTENFYYDNLYRLSYSQLNSTTNLSLTYDAMGNIQSRSDVNGGATWTYDVTKKQVVATTGSGGYSYSRDANGNITNRNGATINWSSYNYPTSLAAGSESTTFYYDPYRQYYKQVYTDGSTTETTHYLGGMLELVQVGGVDDWRHHITADGQLVAIVSYKSVGGNSVAYRLEDNLGSAAVFTNSSGGSIVKESFGAFGLPRDGSSWLGAVPSGDKSLINGLSRRGYTGHSMLGDMGLIHMNGRVQDAVIGRFLSPDPTVPYPDFTQSYNRYSYVENNPVTFIDPSGFAGVPTTYTGSIIPGVVPPFWSCSGDSCAGLLSGGAAGPQSGGRENSSGGGSSNSKSTTKFRVTAYCLELNGGGYDCTGPTPQKNYGFWTNTFNRIATGMDAESVDRMTDEEWLSLVMAQNMGYSFSGEAGLARAAAASIAGDVKVGMAVYRVFGGDAAGLGRYWTTVNPGQIGNFRKAAGLFPGNTGRFVIQGQLTNTSGVLLQRAAPGPNGVGGGLSEVFIPNPGGQVCLVCVSGVNPPF